MNESYLSNTKNSFTWLLVLGLLFLFSPIYLIISQVLHYTNGVFIYPYDDAFIHLTIANHLIKGVWGINANEFASASSSPLYTVILSIFCFFSNDIVIPFLVNCLAGIGILVVLLFWLKKQEINFLGQGLIMLFVIFFTPLALLIISGMEHTIQCLISFLFIFHFSDWLGANMALKTKRMPVKILIFGALTTTIRYEGLFLITIVCILLLVYKKIYFAFLLGFVSLAPLIFFGLFSLSKGNYFLPNSVLVKSGSFSYSGPIDFINTILFEKLTYARNGLAALATQRLIIALPLLYFIFRKYLNPSHFFIIVILLSATILQLAFATTGYLYRYEAYLFFCFTTISALLFYKYGRYVLEDFSSTISKIFAIVIIFFLFFPVVLRSAAALAKTRQACINIYDQQFQMAMFTKKYYNHSTIAVNDIGALGYFTNANILDLWGLASIEITRSKKNHYWTPTFLDSLCKTKHVEIAIIYDSWFSQSLTNRWNKIAAWQIQNNVICGDNTVSFYSLDSSKNIILLKNLQEFQWQLPSSVGIKYYY